MNKGPAEPGLNLALNYETVITDRVYLLHTLPVPL